MKKISSKKTQAKKTTPKRSNLFKAYQTTAAKTFSQYKDLLEKLGSSSQLGNA